jgi:uncharacterized protein (TIGR02594 family)
LNLPSEYAWLAKERFPQILVEAVKLYGTKEVPGPSNSPVIMAWAKELGGVAGKWYDSDAHAWCGLFLAVCALRCGYIPPAGFDALRAKSWSQWGSPVTIPMLGDIVVFSRTGGGHVGLYVGQDRDCYHIIGGNQSDMVRVSRLLKSRAVAYRRSPVAGSTKSLRVVHLHPSGEVSKNEA